MSRLLGLVALLALVSGCGGAASGDGARNDGRLAVIAAFYPLQFVAERVGGPHVRVTNLTKPGAEPHELELSPRQVGAVADADLVVYLPGFQPAVDDAVAAEAAGRALDVSGPARLSGGGSPARDEHPRGVASHPSRDPHFWLDPTRLADVADAVASRLAELDPPHASDYRTGAERLRTDLDELDTQFRQGLAHCATTALVTSHSAFGYLAERYRLQQVGIEGLNPEGEPRPQELADVARFVREHHVSTIYYETLVSPAVAKAVARETGASTAVLDPLEGLSNQSAGDDYVQVMRANLETLRKGQSCS